MTSFHSRPRLIFQSQNELQTWFNDNYKTSKGFWLARSTKNSQNTLIPYDEAIDVALCHGWIDSHVRKAEKTTLEIENSVSSWLYFCPRRKGSVWSKINKQRIERLDTQGKLLPIAKELILKAQADGSWNTLDPVDELAIPMELKDVESKFKKLPKSKQKQFLLKYYLAKRDSTKAKAIVNIKKSLKTIKL